jgi:hypothetical protein
VGIRAKARTFHTDPPAKPLILLLLHAPQFSFAIFCPKIACQVPKPLNSSKTKEIPNGKKIHATSYTKYREKKEKPGPSAGLTYLFAIFWTQPQLNEYFREV